ncbi:uncharacterized protein LOC131851329 [Achroia grisella]|uniref:uncharacterized protein LOC131851329 n=1 Tax=Achroia grisella TaxID=688607 RepID=UPI0027D2382A|nr:uncharacterized protein LOC131851329 [Achroia grisella]
MKNNIVSTLRVIVLVIGVTKVVHAKDNKFKDELLDFSLLSNIFKALIKPYIHPIQAPYKAVLRSVHELSVGRTIKNKVDELKPLLQDLDVTDDMNDNLTLEGKDETTIIEFLPKYKTKHENNLKIQDKRSESLKSNIQKYKNVRRKIKKQLENEHVSGKTQNLVMHTFDDLLAKLLGSQCNWKNYTRDKVKRNEINRLQSSMTVAQSWSKGWNMLKEEYSELTKDQPTNNTNPGVKLFTFFNQIQEFLSHIFKDAVDLSDHYTVMCKFVKKDVNNENVNNMSGDTNDLRSDKQINKKHKCPNFKMCTNELKKFMFALYNSINDTAISVLKNYASMYVSDVNTDGSNEKEVVVNLINKFGDISKRKVSKIFRKETSRFNLDKNKNKENNIKYLKLYIKNTIMKCKESITSKLDDNLQPPKARLLLAVKQDIRVNFDVDFGNLERDLKGTICVAFSTCNGKYNARGNIKTKRYGVDRNSIYVKVQFNLDDVIKDKIVKTGESIFRPGVRAANHTDQRYKKFRKYLDRTPVIIEEKYNNIIVTRTTYGKSIQNLTLTTKSGTNQ